MVRYRTLALAALLIACNDDITGLEPPSDPATETFAASLGISIPAMTRTANGVYYKDNPVGTGTDIQPSTDSVRVNYSGFLKDGTLFDSGINKTFSMNGVIAGFREGLIGAKEGGTRKIVIPSELGYGGKSTFGSAKTATGALVKIPRQSTLVFDVVLLKVFNPQDTTKKS